MEVDSKWDLKEGVYVVNPTEPRKSTVGSDAAANDFWKAQAQDEPVNDTMPMKLKHLQRSASGVKFMLSAFELIFYSPGCSVIWIFLLLGASVACIYFGYMYEGICPKYPTLKDMLIIYGSFGVSKCALGIVEQICRGLGCGNAMDHDDEKEEHQRHVCLSFVDKIFSVLLLLAFLVLCVETYTKLVGDYQTSNRDLPAYCDPLLRTFSMWLCNSTFIFMVLVFIMIMVLIQMAK